MNKNQISKKVLVRNTEKKLPKTVVRTEPHREKSVSSYLCPDKNRNGKFKKPTVNPFTEPKLHTTLRLVEEIKKTEQLRTRKIKNVKDVQETEKKLIEERVTKSVNFPPRETVYKDLISLEISDDDNIIPRIAPSSTSREVNIPKDIEPQLIDYYKPIKKHEYVATVKPPKITDSTLKQYSNLNLHKKMQSWVSDSRGVQINKTMY